VQVVKLSNGRYFVPSALESAMTNKKSLVSIVDPDVADYSSTNVQSGLVDHFCETDAGGYDASCSGVDTDPDAGVAYNPIGISSGVLVGNTIYMTAESETDVSGAVLGFGLTPEGFVDADDLQVVIPTSGNEASAIEYLGGNRVIVLNNSGDSGASVDIIDLEDASVEASIPLGLVNAAHLSEIPVTEGEGFAAVAGEDSLGKAMFEMIDLSDNTVAGSVSLAENAEVRAIDILGGKAYISLDTTEHYQTSGRVAVVDFSTPTSLDLTNMIEVGFDAGSVVAFGAGYVYVVVTDRWWEEPGTAETRWSHVVAFHPDLVTDDLLGD